MRAHRRLVFCIPAKRAAHGTDNRVRVIFRRATPPIQINAAFLAFSLKVMDGRPASFTQILILRDGRRRQAVVAGRDCRRRGIFGQPFSVFPMSGGGRPIAFPVAFRTIPGFKKPRSTCRTHGRLRCRLRCRVFYFIRLFWHKIAYVSAILLYIPLPLGPSSPCFHRHHQPAGTGRSSLQGYNLMSEG